MKLAIFGASVSAQGLNHATKEVTGYAEVLRRDYAARLGLSEVRQITYAGNRASDAEIYAAQIAGELAALGDPAACLARLSVPSGFGQGVQVQQLPPPDPAPEKFTGLTLTLISDGPLEANLDGFD